MNSLIRTPVIDRNGRATHVYRAQGATASRSRAAVAPQPPRPRREVAPAYDADVYYSMFTQGDYLVCGSCRWSRIYASETTRQADRVAHATPIRNRDSLDISCPNATWEGALATAAIQADEARCRSRGNGVVDYSRCIHPGGHDEAHEDEEGHRWEI